MAKKTTTTKSRTRAKTTRPRTAKPAAITEKDNAPVIRREIFNMETLNILLSSIILVVLLYSLSIGGTAAVAPATTTGSQFTSDEASCKIFCEYNPQYGEGEYGGISENGHCLCKITLDEMPNYVQNKTMSATLLIDQGIIIESATITDGAEQQQQIQMMQ